MKRQKQPAIHPRDAKQQALQAQFKLTGEDRYRDELFHTLGRLPWIIGDEKGWTGGTGIAQAFITHCLAITRWDPKKCPSYGRYYAYRLKAALGGEMRRKEAIVVVPKRAWEQGDRVEVGMLNDNQDPLAWMDNYASEEEFE